MLEPQSFYSITLLETNALCLEMLYQPLTLGQKPR
tara:strand:+ start:625 stop:729 length:105 start_codon:yes stop_codon:yes gene_type:complete